MTSENTTNTRLDVTVLDGAPAARSEPFRLLSSFPHFRLRHATDWAALEAELGNRQCDVIVVNGAATNRYSAFEINEKVRRSSDDAPATVLCHGAATVAAARKAFRCGFAEYLPAKGVTGDDLDRAVRFAAGVLADRRRQTDRIRFLEDTSQRDFSTGLPNRHYLRKRLQQLVAAAERYAKRFALILVQVDAIEDVLGRFDGRTSEKVAYACASILRNAARSSDTLGRLDIGTFYYVVENLDAGQDIGPIRARLQQSLSGSLETDEISIKVATASVAVQYPNDLDDTGDILESALAMLQEASASSATGTADRNEPAQDDAPPAHDRSPGRRKQPGRWSSAGRGNAATDETAPSEAVSIDEVIVIHTANRRSSERRRVYKRGMLVYNNGSCFVDCTIKDLSVGGARVATDSLFIVPYELELLIVETGQRRRAEKRWQVDQQSGLMFVH